MKPVIFADLDGFLADFVRGAFRHHGRELPMTDVRWSFDQDLGLSPEQFWCSMDRTYWAGLEPLADGFELLKAAERMVGSERIGIMTSPCDTVGCPDGKRDWIAKHLPAYKKRLFIGSAKELFAGPDKVLIDDHDPNVDRFRAAGGRALLVPRPWNARKAESGPDGSFCPVALAKELAAVLAG